MKKILASLLTAYVMTNGQGPPPDVVTAATSAATTASPQTTLAARLAETTAARAAGTTAAATTSAGASGTTSAPAGLVQSQTTAPVTTASVTTASVTTAPQVVEPARVTPAPVTQRPTPQPVAPPTVNPYCPANAGQQSGVQPQQFNENRVCFTPNEIATDYLGKLRCEKFSCCQCAQINCGFDGYPCDTLRIGDEGAVGVQSINIRGAPEINNNPLQNIFGGAVNNHGAKLECSGREGCRLAVIRGEMLAEAQCSGDFGCQDSKIVLNDPLPMMNTQCSGLQSCERFDLEINIGVAAAAARAPGQACNAAFAGVVTELGKIEFNGYLTGNNARVTIRNLGCGTVLFDSFECMSLESCPGIGVIVEGNVAIRHCDLMGVAPGNPMIASLVMACQAGQAYQNWNWGQNVQNTFPVPGQPTFPVPPVVPAPGTGNPAVPAPPAVNPFQPNPVLPGAGPGSLFAVDPRSSGMQCDQLGMPGIVGPGTCAGQTITLQIANNFVLDCSLAGVCNGMTLILNAGYDPTRNPLEPTTRIDSLKFIEPQSDVTIYINNEFGAMGQPVRINDVRCSENNTCRNLKIIAGPGVDIMSTNYDCGQLMSCIGATVEQGGRSMAMDPRTNQYAGLPGTQPFNPIVPGAIPSNPSNPGPPVQFNPWV